MSATTVPSERYSQLVFKKLNITGWKGRLFPFIGAGLIMLVIGLLMGMISEQNEGTLENRYYSITVPSGYKGEVVKEYEPASYSVAFSKNNCAVFISVVNYDVAKKSIEDYLVNFITANPLISGKLKEVPSFDECTFLDQPAIETRFRLENNNVNAIGFRAENGMLYYSLAFNLSLEEQKRILRTLNIKDTQVEYIDTETFFKTCLRGLVVNVNEYIDESVKWESYGIDPENKEFYFNIELESISSTDIDKEQLEYFRAEIIDYFRQSMPMVSVSENEGYKVLCNIKFGI